MDITAHYTNYCYNNYYRKSTDWSKQDEEWAEKEDRDYEDRVFEELNGEEF